MKRAVLVGAGHAHLYSLKRAAAFVEHGFEVVLVSPERFWYSGLATGVLGGDYEPALDQIDAGALILRGGGRWLQDTVTAIRPTDNALELAGGRTLSYDVLSINVGSVGVPIPGADARVVSIKPLANLARLRVALEASTAPTRVVIVGAGASGCEIAANVRALSRRRGLAVEITLLCAGDEPLPGRPAGVRATMSAVLRQQQVQVRANAVVESVVGNILMLRDGGEIQLDYAVNATGLKPPSLLTDSGLPVDPEGALVVNAFLQSTGGVNVFGGGDCVAMQDRALDRVGVYAIRQAPILFSNLLAFLLGKPLGRFRPQRRYLSILNLGNGSGLATWRGWHWHGRWAFRWKDHLDRSFLAEYRTGLS